MCVVPPVVGEGTTRFPTFVLGVLAVLLGFAVMVRCAVVLLVDLVASPVRMGAAAGAHWLSAPGRRGRVGDGEARPRQRPP